MGNKFEIDRGSDSEKIILSHRREKISSLSVTASLIREKKQLQEIKQLQSRIVGLEALIFTAYCQGYRKGHEDTVEGHYAPPDEYPEEWADTMKDILDT